MSRLKVEVLSLVLDGSDLIGVKISIVLGVSDDGIIAP